MQTFFLFALIILSVVAMVIAISKLKMHPFCCNSCSVYSEFAGISTLLETTFAQIIATATAGIETISPIRIVSPRRQKEQRPCNGCNGLCHRYPRIL